MAEAIARRRIEQLGWAQVEVGSAGVFAFDGGPASGGARRTAVRNGLDLSAHRSSLLTPELAESADLILTMSPSHLQRVVELGAGPRAALLTTFASAGEVDPGSGGVPDPIGGSDEEYGRTFEALEGLVGLSLERLEALVAS
jgi:protein-tyrosine-phosphatase